MDKNSLYRFFEGQASIEEMKAVKEWAESSEEHSKQFHRERKLFNAMILIGNPKWTAINTTKRNRYFIREFLKIASVIIIAVSITATIFSITNEPAKIPPICGPSIVSDGIKAFLNTCFLTILNSLTPFALAVKI